MYQKEDMMAKKFGKFVLLSSIGAAAGAGIYYYLKGKKDAVPEDNFDADDFDDFDDDLDDDFDNTSSTVKSHPHMPIDLDSAKEKIGGKVIETLDKAKEFIGEVTSTGSSEPAYTKVDLPPRNEEKKAEEAPQTDEAPKAEAPKTEETSTTDANDTEEFFNDSEE